MFKGRINRNSRGGNIISSDGQLKSSLLRHNVERLFGTDVLGKMIDNCSYFFAGPVYFWHIHPTRISEAFT